MKINRLFLLLFFFLTTNYSYSFNIKILWWNVHDFFDTIDDPEKDDKIYSNEEYNNKLFNISNQLKKIDADIIGLGEIENINVLKNLAINSGYQYYYLIEGNDTRGIDIALLSRYKLEAYISNRNRYTPYDENPKYKFSRDATVGIVKINDIRLYIITTHLKAGFQENNKNEKKKIAQVFGLLDIIYEIYKKESNPYIILMGDFNSHRYSEPMNILEKSGLIIINYFYNENITYTYRKNNKKDIDYFIINKNLYNRIKGKNLTTFNNKKFAKISDHFPLLLELKF